MDKQSCFISLLPDEKSIALLEEHTHKVISDSGLANRGNNSFLHLTLLHFEAESFNSEIINNDFLKDWSKKLNADFTVSFELIRHNKNKYLYCALPSPAILFKDLRLILKNELLNANVKTDIINSGQYLPHVTLINNINPYQKYLISKKINHAGNLSIRFKGISVYKNHSGNTEKSTFEFS